jgi:hypothetical protein
MQLGDAQVARIVAALNRSRTGRLLVFGLGNDSPFWSGVPGNAEGFF